MTTTTRRWWAAALPPANWEELPWLPFLPPAIPIEEYRSAGRFVVRAELPGLDPATDIYVGCHREVLRLHVHRTARADAGHSEFRYGSRFRAVPLPAGARLDGITASYVNGILEITVPVDEPPAAVTQVPVSTPDGDEG